MAKLNSCPIPGVSPKDVRLTELRKEKSYEQYNEAYLAHALNYLKRKRPGMYADDWVPETPQERAMFTRFIRYELNKTKRQQSSSAYNRDDIREVYNALYNLYPNSPETLDSRIAMMANDFLDQLDKIAGSRADDETRRKRLQALGKDGKNGFKVLMERVFKIYEKRTNAHVMYEMWLKENPDATQLEKMRAEKFYERASKEYQKVLDNKEMLSVFVATKVGNDEGFKVRSDGFEITFDEVRDEDMVNPEELSNDDDNVDIYEVSKGDRYNDFWTLKLMETLGPRARKLLSRIPRTDANGETIKDDLYNIKYIGPRQAAVVLNRSLVHSSPETMLEGLLAMGDIYPWLKSFVNETLIKNQEAQTTIWCAFKKAETFIVYDERDKNSYRSLFANSRSRGRSLMEEAGNNLTSGIPMSDYFIVNNTGWLDGKAITAGIAKAKELQKKIADDLANVRMVYGDSRMSKPSNDYAGMDPVEAIDKFFKDNPKVSQELADLARGLGFAVTARDIEATGKQMMTKKGYKYLSGVSGTNTGKGRNKLSILISTLLSGYNNAKTVLANSKKVAPTGQTFYNSTGKELSKLTDIMALSKANDVERRVLLGKKSANTYNNTNLLNQIAEELFNQDGADVEDYQARLIDNYGKYEGMAITEEDENGQGQLILTGWLKYLHDNAKNMEQNDGEKFRLYTNPGFNHVEYRKMSPKQKVTSSIIQFVTGGKAFNSGYAGYEMPIKADYATSYDFILAPRFEVETEVNAVTGDYTYKSEIVEGLIDELLCEIERINDISDRVRRDEEGKNRAKLDTYEKRGLKINLFPELDKLINTREFRYDLKTQNVEQRRNTLRDLVCDELTKTYERDMRTVEDKKILSNKLLAPHELYSPDGSIAGLTDKGRKILLEWSLNEFYARTQMVKLFDGGLHNFNNTDDFNKRNMLLHTTRTSLYTKAWWGGKQVGKDSQKVAYIKDERSKSAFYDDIAEILKNLKDDKLISPRQYDTMLKSYEDIKSTDGQGFRTLESWREVMIMTDQWSDKLEAAYNRIIAGNPTRNDIDMFLKVIKPMTTGFETLDATATGGKKPVKLTVLHKYSEAPLLPLALAKYCMSAQSVPLRAFVKTAEKTGVDLFLFDSCVKVGSHSVMAPLMRWDDKQFKNDADRKAHGWDGKEALDNHVLKDEDSISDYLVKSLTAQKWNIHEIPYKYYGISASTPVHTVDGTISRASQMEKTSMSNLKKGDKIFIGDREYEAIDMRDLYYKIKTTGLEEAYNELRSLFNNTDELARIFEEELADKTYVPRELRFALAHLSDGDFALPLFTPNVTHQVEQVLLSIIKKRLTKQKERGANMLVSSAIGLEADNGAYIGGMSNLAKLGMEFIGTGKNKRIKWFDCGIALPDSLKEFADENGNITYEMLWGKGGLVDRGIIPESALIGVASRTPSDAEHSSVPYRIKWFSAGLDAGSGKVAKEAIVMTGQDFDGDKLRVDFKEFHLGWDEAKMSADYEKEVEHIDGDDNLSIMRTILGQTNEEIPSYEQWSEAVRNKNNKRRLDYRRVIVDEYDMSKPVHQNSRAARHNMQIDILFGMLTSESGSRRVLVPGGCEETKIYAKSLELTRLAADEENRKKIREAMLLPKDEGGLGMNQERVSKILATTTSRYKGFRDIGSSDDLSILMDAVEEGTTPYSVTDALVAFDDIMGGAQMIDVYALYNSAIQMLQRLDIHYVPMLKQDGTELWIKLFGHEIDKLCDVEGANGQLNSLGMASLLNAAVDNGKDPVLGYLHQVPSLAEITAFLSAAGYSEEDIHLIMNQPAVIELIDRMQDTGDGMSTVINKMTSEMQSRFGGDAMGLYKAISTIGKMTRDDFISYLDENYSDINGMTEANADKSKLDEQTAILMFLNHISVAAGNFSEFIKVTRPESNSGAVGSSIANVVNKKKKLDDMRALVGVDGSLTGPEMQARDREVRLSGLRYVLTPREIQQGMDYEVMDEIIGNELPETVALNTFMIDGTLEMLDPYFPQAKRSWYEVCGRVASMYQYKQKRDSTFNTVATEMILYKLLQNKNFVGGDVSENRQEAIVEIPYALLDIKNRIEKATAQRDKLKGVEVFESNGKKYFADKEGLSHEVITDEEAEWLIGNQFLQHLGVTSPEPGNSRSVPRIKFNLNGAAIEGQTDIIRAYWAQMLNSPYENTRQLAIDLYMYNLYNSGFGYGMYEFAHFAPMSVIMQTPGYIDALKKLLDKAEWSEEDENNFTDQYLMNHWGDEKLLFWQDAGKLKYLETDFSGDYPVFKVSVNAILRGAYALYNGFVVLYDRDGNQGLYKITAIDKTQATLHGVAKIAVRLRNGQASLHYDPDKTFDTIRPAVTGNESAWGQVDLIRSDYEAGADYNAPGAVTDDEASRASSLVREATGKNFMYLPLSEQEKVFKSTPNDTDRTRRHQVEAVKNAAKNEENLRKLGEDTEPVETVDVNPEAWEQGTGEEQFVSASPFVPGTFFQIAQRDENGNVKTVGVSASPAGIREARRQRAYVELANRLREILKEKGVAVGVLDDFETRLFLNGITDFDTMKVTAEGLVEMIRIAEGLQGDMALPEEFAHLAIGMIGLDNPMVARLLNILSENEEALKEAFGDQYQDYLDAYEDDMEKMLVEAAGKLVAKQLLYNHEIETPSIRSWIRRIVDAIKNFFRQFSKDRIKRAIFDSENISRELARQFVGGQILDDRTINDINLSGSFHQKAQKVKKDLSNKDDILNRLLKIELKKLDAYTTRIGYDKEKIKASESIQSTNKTIARLEAGIRNLKTEDAIITYLADSTDFLNSTIESLQDVIESGKPANNVCRKLNTTRDTLYGIASSIDEIRQAVQKQEIYDTINLRDSLKSLEDILNSSYKYYERYAKHYFEGMLADVYGKDGLTIEVGREKGRTITIDEMATRADRDISMASRWFNAIADCGDPVLSAMDEFVRSAKIRSRQRLAEFKPRLEAAYAKLVRETGSKDQSFMFEYETVNGKKVKSGKYINALDAQKLSKPQRDFYNTIMDLKAEIDRCMPDSLLQERKIVMLRKKTWDKVKEQEGIKNKTMEAWEGVKSSILETNDDVEFDTYEVRVDFQGNKIDMLPVHYLAKGKNETYDDMVDDVATSIMAYAGMAFEYHEMNSIIGILENAKYMAAERDVAQKTGLRNIKETVSTTDYTFTKDFTVKQARTQMQKVLEDFFQMHIYGHLQKDEGVVPFTKISKRKATNFLNMIVSYSQMALNLPQRIANVGVGMTQIGIESAGKDTLRAKNVAKASKIWMQYGGDRMAETGKADYDNKLSLWLDYFDVHQDNGKKATLSHSKSKFAKFFNSHLLFAGLTVGEDYLASVTALSVAQDYKLKLGNKDINLFDAFEVKYVDAAHKEGAYLALRDGVTKADGSQFTQDDVQKITKQIATLNFEMQGIYNEDDRSAVQQYAFGSLIIMYRKWIAPAMKRRYSKTHYNALSGRWEEGFYRTMCHLLYDSWKGAPEQMSEEEANNAMERIVNTFRGFISSVKMNWDKFSPYEKSNIRKSITEMSILLGLIITTSIFTKLPPPDPENDVQPVSKFLSWAEQHGLALAFRMRTEVGSMAPSFIFLDESLKILKSPFAAIGPLRDATNFFQLFYAPNYFTVVKSGKDKGHTKAYHYFWNLPVLSMRRKLQNFKNPSSLINYYKNDNF